MFFKLQIWHLNLLHRFVFHSIDAISCVFLPPNPAEEAIKRVLNSRDE